MCSPMNGCFRGSRFCSWAVNLASVRMERMESWIELVGSWPLQSWFCRAGRDLNKLYAAMPHCGCRTTTRRVFAGWIVPITRTVCSPSRARVRASRRVAGHPESDAHTRHSIVWLPSRTLARQCSTGRGDLGAVTWAPRWRPWRRSGLASPAMLGGIHPPATERAGVSTGALRACYCRSSSSSSSFSSSKPSEKTRTRTRTEMTRTLVRGSHRRSDQMELAAGFRRPPVNQTQ